DAAAFVALLPPLAVAPGLAVHSSIAAPAGPTTGTGEQTALIPSPRLTAAVSVRTVSREVIGPAFGDFQPSLFEHVLAHDLANARGDWGVDGPDGGLRHQARGRR